jgi:hypothetical protein
MRLAHLIAVGALVVPVIATAGFSVSSFKKTSRTSETGAYGAQAALDGDPSTAWVIDPENENPGQWIEVDIPLGKVDKISIIPGWSRDEDTWVDYARLKEARLEVIDLGGDVPKTVYEKEITLQDIKERQFFDLPDTQVGGEFAGGRVRLTVKSVHEGRDFAHLALGELLIHMVEFDAATVTIVDQPSSEHEQHDGSNLFDGDAKTFWAANKDGEAEFTMAGGRYSVSSIGILPGPATFGRPKTIEITQNGAKRKYEMTDKIVPQWFELPPLVGYTGSGVGPVTVKIIDVYPGTTSSAPAVAEIKFKATMLEAF